MHIEPGPENGEKMKLKGTALPIVMIFSILIGSLLSIEVLKTELMIKEIDIIRERMDLNDLIRMRQQQLKRDDTIETGTQQLAEGRKLSTEISRWGMLDLVKLVARSANVDQKSAFILSYVHDTSLIWINSRERNIELSDSAAITGYEGNSRKIQNVYNNGRKAYYEISSSKQIENTGPTIPSFPIVRSKSTVVIPRNDTINRSFFEEALVIFSAVDIHLDNVQIQGQVYIRSEGTIHLDSSASLDGVILSGKQIRIGDGTRLCGQLFADESLLIGENAEIKFPSVIALTGETKNIARHRNKTAQIIPFIRFESGSRLCGSVIHSGNGPDDPLPILFLEPGSMILGEVHFDGLAHLEGKIFGAATINELVTVSDGNIESGRMKQGQLRGFRNGNGFSLIRKSNKRFIGKYLS